MRLIKKLSALLMATFLLTACSSNVSTSTLTIGLDPSFSPLNVDNQEANIEGFCLDLFTAIGKCGDINITLQRMQWPNLLRGLQKNDYDLIVSSKMPQVFNEDRYAFSDLFLSTAPVLVVPFSSSIHSLDNLEGKTVSVDEADKALLVTVAPQAIPSVYTSVRESMNGLENGDYDAALIPVLLATKYCRDLYYGKLKTVSEPLGNNGLRLVTLKGNQMAAIRKFNACLKELQENGSYEALLKKWSLL